MTNLMNELPVAVHLASGGDARLRTGGQVISLSGVQSGSFTVTGATRYRLLCSTRSTGGLIVLVGYTSPVTLANASWVVIDFGQLTDDVPDGTTVHVAVLSPEDLSPTEGGALDALYVSYYG